MTPQTLRSHRATASEHRQPNLLEQRDRVSGARGDTHHPPGKHRKEQLRTIRLPPLGCKFGELHVVDEPESERDQTDGVDGPKQVERRESRRLHGMKTYSSTRSSACYE